MIKYRSDIDGLRALAVVPVVLFHAGVAGVPGGFVGVDIFFVISGYLITSIIVGEIERGSFSIAGFYERRIRRILPNLFAMMAASLAVALLVLIPFDLAYFGQSLTAAALSLSNVLFSIKTGYFDPNASQVALLHTWSLAVEEQYYLLFPLLMMALMGQAKVAARPIVWLLFGLSFAFSVWQVRASPSGAFYLPFGRWWELMTGSLLAVGAVPAIAGRRWREALAAAGLAAILAAILLFREDMRFPGEAALLPCLGTAAIVHANQPGSTWVGRLLSLRPLVWIGLISYSLYLWHWPPLMFARYVLQRDLDGAETAMLLALIVALAWLAWRFVERPLRRPRHGWTRRRIFAFALGGTAAFCGIGVALWQAAGLPQRYPPSIRPLATSALDTNPLRAECDEPSARRLASGDVCQVGRAAASRSFAFVGDSFADAMAPGVARAAEHTGTRGLVVTHPGCLPLVGARGCPQFWHATYRMIAADPAVDTVIVNARWSTFVEGNRFGLFRAPWQLVTDAMSTETSLAENRRAIVRSLARTAAMLRPKRLVVLAFMPEQKVDVPQFLTLRSLTGGSLHGLSRREFEARQADTRRLIEQAARLYGFTVVDASRTMCDAAECSIVDRGVSLYADDSHLSRAGAERFSAMLDSTLLASRR